MRVKLFTVAALALALTACGAQSEPTPAAPPAPPKPVVLTFGQSHTWPTGDTITISNPARDRSNLTLTIAYRNGSQAVEPLYGINSLLLINAYSDDAQLQPVFAQGDAVPPDNILPGRTVTYRQTYELAATGPIALQVQASGSMGDPTRPVVFYEGTV